MQSLAYRRHDRHSFAEGLTNAAMNDKVRWYLPQMVLTEILRTLRTPSLSDNETLKTLRTQSLLNFETLRTLSHRVFRTLKLFVLSDFEFLGVADSPYIQTPSL